MIDGTVALPHGITARPARRGDKDFLAKLYRANRDDIRLAEGETDYLENIIEMQLEAQINGYGDQFPNALYLVLEKNGSRIGRVTFDIGSVELRLIDLDFIKKAKNKGYGSGIIIWMMQTAAKIKKPALVPARRDNQLLLRFLHKYGYTEESTMSDDVFARMIWFPTTEEMAGLTDIRPRPAVMGAV
ncbi:hypothetical protein KFE96_03660 [Kordiimonas sp. SCSIO 12603]|uniref:hypothetical protein n=1 Tax=Kordiimonas sp. SCSIO 12603 TaxID=2829596 RepID=UPI002102A797|nr:hypothetical protein [Kordiimonas sp. SCSIO 12603]UTW59416.1 hypothetical protein KFE96_03660 [Kordiimonas sp. SCSIO 12603]